jgi:hypothetical protein
MGQFDLNHIRTTRKRGGKVENYTYGGRGHLLKAIEQKGEGIPGDLARELGWSRSTLAHNLAKLHAQKKIVKVGGGRSTRYRIAASEETLPVTPPTQAPTPFAASNPPVDQPQGKGILTAGLRRFFKKVLKS